MIKVLNLYAGIGGNRKFWNNCNITAVENDNQIADKYKQQFPNDKIIIDDAHQFLLENYKEFDFIWSSPPCPTHSRTNYFLNPKGIIRYPDMKLWQEIIFLSAFFKGYFVVENVISYYKPILNPQQIGRHYFWSNFNIPKIKQPTNDIGRMNGKNQPACKKHKTERNAVNSELGLHIFNQFLEVKK